MSQFGAGIDELEVDSFQSGALGVHQHGFTQSDNALLGSNAASLDHDEIIVDLAVEWISSHWGDGLIGDIVLGGSIVLDELQL